VLQTLVVEKIKTQFTSINLSSKIVSFMR